MKRHALPTLAIVLALAGCSSGPSAEERTEAAAAFMETRYAAESAGLAQALAEADIFTDNAEILVDGCEDGWSVSNAATFAAQFDTDPAMQQIILDAWDVACPS